MPACRSSSEAGLLPAPEAAPSAMESPHTRLSSTAPRPHMSPAVDRFEGCDVFKPCTALEAQQSLRLQRQLLLSSSDSKGVCNASPPAGVYVEAPRRPRTVSGAHTPAGCGSAGREQLPSGPSGAAQPSHCNLCRNGGPRDQRLGCQHLVETLGKLRSSRSPRIAPCR